MAFKYLCVFVLWMKVALPWKGLKWKCANLTYVYLEAQKGIHLLKSLKSCSNSLLKGMILFLHMFLCVGIAGASNFLSCFPK